MRFTRNGIRFFYEIDDVTYAYFSSYRESRPTLDSESLYQTAFHIGLSYLVDIAILVVPETIAVKPIRLDPPAVSFWKEAYQQLAMERLYIEGLDTSLLDARWVSAGQVPLKPRKEAGSGTLLALSGGKESLTALKLLGDTENLGLFFLQFAGDSWQHMRRSFEQLRDHYPVMGVGPFLYKVDDLFDRYGSSDYFTFVIGQLLFNALLYADQYRYLVIGNEYSANYGNTIYQGRQVNHQYDKSLRFARRANRYVHRYVSRQFTYFSPFFGLYEYQIARTFLADARYLDLWTSCNLSTANANFCCQCVKCAFTYAICLPWTTKKVLNRVFGQDLLGNLEIFRPLMDPDAIKPMDCVGEKEEVWLSLYRIWSEKKDRSSPVIRYFVANILPHVRHRLAGIQRELESEHTDWAYVPLAFRGALCRGMGFVGGEQINARREEERSRHGGIAPAPHAGSIQSAARRSSPPARRE